MFKHTIKIIIPTILILIILIIGYNSYKEISSEKENPLSIIPSNTALILQLRNLDNIIENLQESNVTKLLMTINNLENIENHLKKINNIFKKNTNLFNSDNTFLISFHKVGANNSGILYTTNFSLENIKNNKQIISILGNEIKKTEYDNQIIYSIEHENQETYCSFKNDIFFLSTSKMLIQDVIKETKNSDNLLNNKEFHKSYKTISKSSSINLFINYNKLIELGNIYTKEKNKTINFSEWVSTDVNIKDNAIIINGFSTINHNIKNYTDIFTNTSTINKKVFNILPHNTTMILNIGCENMKTIFTNKNKLLQKQNKFWSWNKNRKQIYDSTKVDYNELIEQIESEAGIFQIHTPNNYNNKFSFFKVTNPIKTTSLMQGMIEYTKKYKNYTINKCKDNKITTNLFGQLLDLNNNFFTYIEEYVVFGISEESIKYIIDNYIAKNTLNNNKYFKKYRDYLITKDNLLLYTNPGKRIKNLTNLLKKEYSEKLIIYKDSIFNLTGFSMQLSRKNDLMLHNMSLYYEENIQENIEEKWFAQLDTTIAIHPQFVKNHFTKQEMIIVQTHTNIIYALNPNGDIIWKKPINSQVIGDVNSIDIYKNNKYQSIFNTKEELYVIDRNGKDVDGFPKRLPKKSSLGHVLFDYNKNKQYRILITGDDNKFYNLNSKGTKVKGWKHKKQEQNIINPPKHFQIKGKDYILEETNGSSSKLLARNGTDRVIFEKKYTFNKNGLQVDKDGVLYAVTKNGKLWKGKLDGSSYEIIIPNLQANSLLLITELNNQQYILFTNEETVFALNNTLDLEYSFNVKSKIKNIFKYENYIGIETQDKISLWNKEILIPGFPIRTDGFYNISDIDKNGKINIINSYNGSLYNYEIINSANMLSQDKE